MTRARPSRTRASSSVVPGGTVERTATIVEGANGAASSALTAACNELRSAEPSCLDGVPTVRITKRAPATAAWRSVTKETIPVARWRRKGSSIPASRYGVIPSQSGDAFRHDVVTDDAASQLSQADRACHADV